MPVVSVKKEEPSTFHIQPPKYIYIYTVQIQPSSKKNMHTQQKNNSFETSRMIWITLGGSLFFWEVPKMPFVTLPPGLVHLRFVLV